jgi:hypothetical protein
MNNFKWREHLQMHRYVSSRCSGRHVRDDVIPSWIYDLHHSFAVRIEL